MRRRIGWISLLIVAGLAAGILVARSKASAAPAAPVQPIAFTHRVHASAGVPCLFCHPNALRSPIAGIPSVERCMGCHRVIIPNRARTLAIKRYFEAGEPIPWIRVNTEPDFVYFSHQPHLSAGLNCETCHGDVGQMEVVQPVARMDMGWCLDCHLEQPEEKAARLTDCLVCHQ